MYQALYRKYRPQKLDEIAGQEVVVKILKNAIKKDKISHAYLFCGPRGTGKTSIAKILAKTINCEHLEDFIPCDQCSSCTQINNKNSNDIIEIDAASNNGVDERRELKSKINIVPTYLKYKVYIIDEVHMLSIGAFNALLKTLEEPPAHAIFILATTEIHKVPATILSRCQVLEFKKISKLDMKNRILEISRRSLIIPESLIALRFPIETNFSMFSVISPALPLRIMSIAFLIAVNGVLNSCDTIEINSDFKRSSFCNFLFVAFNSCVKDALCKGIVTC